VRRPGQSAPWRSGGASARGEHSDEGLLDVVTNFIIAGRDTTSSALTWFF
jgi:cytochrome P450